MFCLDTVADVKRHDCAGDVRHAAGHDGHQFRFGHFWQERPDGQWSFRLPHENAGRHVQRLSPARAHDPLHQPSRRANDNLHHAKVIKQSEQRLDGRTI